LRFFGLQEGELVSAYYIIRSPPRNDGAAFGRKEIFAWGPVRRRRIAWCDVFHRMGPVRRRRIAWCDVFHRMGAGPAKAVWVWGRTGGSAFREQDCLDRKRIRYRRCRLPRAKPVRMQPRNGKIMDS